MLFPTNLLVALAAFTTTTTLAAPTSSDTSTHQTTPQPVLNKRADYHAVSVLGDSDYCGEASPHYSFGDTAPLAADCTALYQANAGPGYWQISPAETSSAPDRWVRLAASGTCAFEVRQSPDGGAETVEYRFGTNDVRFYIRSHASEYEAKDGRVAANAVVACRLEGIPRGSARVDWRVVHA